MKKKSQLMLNMVIVVAVTTFVQPMNDTNAMAESVKKEPFFEEDAPKTKALIPATINNSLYGKSNPKEHTQKQSKNQMKAVMKYVDKAELSQSGEDIYVAQLLVDKMPVRDRKSLTNRLNNIPSMASANTKEQIKSAKREVFLAESSYKDETQLKKAQKQVASLYLTKERTDLVERLHIIHMKLLKDREELIASKK